MSRIIITEGAAKGLENCRQFLTKKNPLAARRAAKIISEQLMYLEADPHIGKPFALFPEFRELIIEFGDSGYIALYCHDEAADVIYILAFKHQKEAGY